MKTFKKVLIIFGLIWFGVIFYLAGYLIGHKNFIFEKNYQPKLINLELKKPKEVDFSVFWKAWEIVGAKYVGEYSVQKMVYGAIRGMVEALGDPYSSFLEPQENQRLTDDLSGQVEGIGAELTDKDGMVVVVAPLEGSPAEKAGLKAQDQILAIDGLDATQMTLDEAVTKIRGKAGTEVTLTILRQGASEPIEMKITRAKVANASVKWEMKDGVGYIKITQFGDDTSDLAKQAAEELLKQKPKAIILDLRNNPGGYLDASIDVASLFVPKDSVVVKEQYKDGSKEELKTTLGAKLQDYKVIVLINEGSASAAEITAGALQDLKGATLVGKKSFGKGTVQELVDLGSGMYLRITVAKWLTPKDKAIDKEGIKPDIEVERSEQDLLDGKDPQLDKALELGQN